MAKSPGRPRSYPSRERTSMELSSELLKEIDNRRGQLSRALYVEQELRRLYGMSNFEALDVKQVSESQEIGPQNS